MEGGSLGGPNTLMINDPIGSLLQVGEDVFLALLMLSSVKRSGKTFSAVTLLQLDKANVEIMGQLLILLLQEPTEEDYDWYCTPVPTKQAKGSLLSSHLDFLKL